MKSNQTQEIALQKQLKQVADNRLLIDRCPPMSYFPGRKKWVADSCGLYFYFNLWGFLNFFLFWFK